MRRSARSAGRSGAWGVSRPWRCRPRQCGAQLEDVDLAQGVAEDGDGALAGEEVAGGDVQEGRFAGAVGSEDDPALALLDRPGDLVHQSPALPDHGYVLKLQNIAHERVVSPCSVTVSASRLCVRVVGAALDEIYATGRADHSIGPVLRVETCSRNRVQDALRHGETPFWPDLSHPTTPCSPSSARTPCTGWRGCPASRGRSGSRSRSGGCAPSG